MAVSFFVGDSPGTGGCVTDLCCPENKSDSGTCIGCGSYTALNYSIANVCVPSDLSMTVVYDFWNNCTNRLRVYANGSVVYDTGCKVGAATGYFTIPAGTNTIKYLVDGNCDGATCNDLWSVNIFCS